MATQYTPLLEQEYKERLSNHRGEVVTSGDRLEQVERMCIDSPVLVFDYETSGTRWHSGSRAVGLAVAALDGERLQTFYVPWAHATGEKQIPATAAKAFQWQILSVNNLKIAHNAKFDIHFAWNEIGGPPAGGIYDTMIAASLYDENERIGLKERAARDLGETDALELDKELGLFAKQLAKEQKLGIRRYLDQHGYSEIPVYLAGFYACADVEFTYRLFDYYQSWGMLRFYGELFQTEMRLLRALVRMERNGQRVDAPYLWHLSQKLSSTKHRLREEIAKEAGLDFNPGSETQVRRLLFERYKLKPESKTRSGEASVDRRSLESYERMYPVVKHILDYRDADKIQGTYCYGLLGLADNQSVLHPEFQQTGTNTGRLSCRNPNFQNISGDDQERAAENSGVDPWSIKRAFVVPENYTRFYLDYSQIELRVIAWFAQDESMIKTFLEDGDIHSLTSLKVFGNAEKHNRRKAKVLNFGISYGMSAFGFARNTGESQEKGQAFLAEFDRQFPGIRRFKTELFARMVQSGGQFQNPFGRSRRIPDIMSIDLEPRLRAERQAIASLIQGTAAEIMKSAIGRVHQFIEESGLGETVLLTNTVHDELQFDIREDQPATPIVAAVKNIMEDFPLFNPVPIKVDCEWSSTNWAEKADYP